MGICQSRDTKQREDFKRFREGDEVDVAMVTDA